MRQQHENHITQDRRRGTAEGEANEFVLRLADGLPSGRGIGGEDAVSRCGREHVERRDDGRDADPQIKGHAHHLDVLIEFDLLGLDQFFDGEIVRDFAQMRVLLTDFLAVVF